MFIVRLQIALFLDMARFLCFHEDEIFPVCYVLERCPSLEVKIAAVNKLIPERWPKPGKEESKDGSSTRSGCPGRSQIRKRASSGMDDRALIVSETVGISLLFLPPTLPTAGE